MGAQLQLSSSAMGWKIWVFLRINQLHDQAKILPTGTGFCQFSLCNMIKHKRNVRSLITTIYLPAKLFLLRPSGNIQDSLRYLSDCSQIFFYQVYNSLQWRTSSIRAKHHVKGKGARKKKEKRVKLCRCGSKMRAYLTFQGWNCISGLVHWILNLGWKGSLCSSVCRGGKAVCVISLGKFMFNIIIIISPDKFMQSENISNIANLNAIQIPYCSINTVDRVQIFLAETHHRQVGAPLHWCGKLQDGAYSATAWSAKYYSMKMWLKNRM